MNAKVVLAIKLSLSMAFALFIIVGLPVIFALVSGPGPNWDCRVIYDPVGC